MSQLTHKSDTEVLAVPKGLALLIREIIDLYYHQTEREDQSEQSVIESLKNLIAIEKEASSYTELANQELTDYPIIENPTDFLKSWDDIFKVHVYIDTDIYGELDSRPPALVEIDSANIISETVIQHEEATEAYVQSWKELAQSMAAYPDDLFTRLWTTMEVAKILQCSPRSLRRSRKSGRLPIKINNFVLDCISHDGKRSLWFVRPI
ncbi:MAG: hypothetical protein WCP16_14200 [Pseudanabaena sp. ELA645]|jgi:hypothetical protein